MFKKLLALILFLGLVGLSLFSSSLARGGMQIKGSDTMVNLVQAWAEAYMEQKPEAFIAVTGGGSGTGFAALINGTSSMAASSRKIKSKEITLAEKRGVNPTEYKVALDGLAVVVHPDNSISQLTLDQLSDIFMGKIKNWKEVGGHDAEIVLLSREVNSGTHIYFKEHILKRGKKEGRIEFSPYALLMPSSQAIADEIKQNRDAIGYYGMGYVNEGQKALSIAIDDQSEYYFPSLENVLEGSYPISRPLFLYTDGKTASDVEDFLNFILSEEGQKIVVEIDFVPIRK